MYYNVHHHYHHYHITLMSIVCSDYNRLLGLGLKMINDEGITKMRDY